MSSDESMTRSILHAVSMHVLYWAETWSPEHANNYIEMKNRLDMRLSEIGSEAARVRR